MSEDYDNMSVQLHDDDSPDNSTIASASFMEEETGYQGQYASTSRKRKRGHQDIMDQQHMLYADALLDYFMLSASDAPIMQHPPPSPPDSFEVDRPIDDQGHTALHWAAAMGDIDIVRSFLGRGANPAVRNKRGETPLIRAVLFTNNYEKDTMLKLVQNLLGTIRDYDHHGGTVLHHLAMTTTSHVKKKCARYYLDILLNKMTEICTPPDFSRLVNLQDNNGDTALHIVARHNAKKCIRALQGRGVRDDIHNRNGETADHLLQSRRSLHHDFASSSPLGAEFGVSNGHEMVKVLKTSTATHYHSQSARSFSQSFGPIAQDKSLQVSLAYEGVIREKDEDLAEGQRLQKAVENDRQRVKQATLQHYANGDDKYDEEEVQRMREEEKRLRAESESLSEQIQHKELHHFVRSEEQTLPASAHRKSNGAIPNDTELEEQYHAAIELIGEQSKRRKLTATVAEAQGSAGMSQHGEALKRLVSVTCAVSAEEVPHLVPELLEELQQEKIGIGSEVAAFA